MSCHGRANANASASPRSRADTCQYRRRSRASQGQRLFPANPQRQGNGFAVAGLFAAVPSPRPTGGESSGPERLRNTMRQCSITA